MKTPHPMQAVEFTVEVTQKLNFQADKSLKTKGDTAVG